MASVTAGESRGSRADADPHLAPVGLATLDVRYKGESTLVYGTAHRAFRFLLDRYGEERIRRLVASVGEGQDFAEAFQHELGIPIQEFESDFLRSEPS
jgi:hypothetical protein